MIVIIILGIFISLLGIVLIGCEVDDVVSGLGCIMLLFLGIIFTTIGIIQDYKDNAMKEHNINQDVIEYIIEVRNQKDKTSIITSDAIAVYIECKRNGFSEEETISFLLPDITKEEAKSIVKTYNLLEKEN